MKLLTIKILCICIAVGTLFSCSNTNVKSKESAISLQVTNQGINILWKGQNKITGGIPILQEKQLSLSSTANAKTIDDETWVKFNYNLETSSIDIKTDIDSTKDVMVLSMSTNGVQSDNGADYVGLFFDNLPLYKEGMASYLFGDWESWTKPVQVTDYKNTLPEKILFYLFKYSDGTYGAIMPLAGAGYISTLGSQQNRFGARSVSYKDNFDANNVPLMAIAFGTDPYQTISNLYEVGMESMGTPEGLRKNKTYPEIFESIGWCSWNALGEDVTEQKLMDAVSTFKDNNFPIPFMLIDDGWLSINNEQQLVDFNFDKEKFPNGFKESISRLKSNYGIKDIGVWHTMNGYWSGISKTDFKSLPDSLLLPYYDKDDVHSDTLSGKTYYTPNAQSIAGKGFYDVWYNYLKDQGISFVKVDQQSVIKRVAKGQLNNKEPFLTVAKNMESNLQTAIKEHFNGAVVNCQNMATEAVYNFGSSAIGRNSDDFFPERTAYYSLEVEKGNAAAHVLMNVHNSVWFSNMVWPDFDMFQSHHIDAEYHAINRAISGGPIYLTDTPGKQNFKILNQLILNDGSILRPDVPALPTKDCLFQLNEEKPFKSFSRVGETGVLGVWNTVDADVVKGTISPSDINGIYGAEFAVLDYFTKDLKKLNYSDTLNVELGRMGYKLYIIAPLENNMAVLGLINKYIASKAIIKKEVSLYNMEVTLAEAGEFAAVLPANPSEVIINGEKVQPNSWTFNNGLFILNIPVTASGEQVTVKINISTS